MKINIKFFYKKLPLTIERDSLYLGQVYNNELKIPERKVLCISYFDYIEDVLFESPHYSIESKKNYTVQNLVSLGAFLEYLNYPEILKSKDIRRIYNQVLSSTKTLHKHCSLFGIVRIYQKHIGRNVYWPSSNRTPLIDQEKFYELENLISLPTVPSEEEKQKSKQKLRKRLFFVS